MDIVINVNIKKLSTNTILSTDEYIKRLSAFCNTKIICQETLNIQDIQKNTYNYRIIPSNYNTKTISSEEFAQEINRLMTSGFSRIIFYVGYDKSQFDNATNIPINPFAITSPKLSTEITTIALTEQIYRGFTILNNILYHK